MLQEDGDNISQSSYHNASGAEDEEDVESLGGGGGGGGGFFNRPNSISDHSSDMVGELRS